MLAATRLDAPGAAAATPQARAQSKVGEGEQEGPDGLTEEVGIAIGELTRRPEQLEHDPPRQKPDRHRTDCRSNVKGHLSAFGEVSIQPAEAYSPRQPRRSKTGCHSTPEP